MCSNLFSYFLTLPHTLNRPSIGNLFRLVLFVSEFLGRLQPSQTFIQKTRGTLRVEESSYPRKVLHFDSGNSSRGRMRAELWRFTVSHTFTHFLTLSLTFSDLLWPALTFSDLLQPSPNFLKPSLTISDPPWTFWELTLGDPGTPETVRNSQGFFPRGISKASWGYLGSLPCSPRSRKNNGNQSCVFSICNLGWSKLSSICLPLMFEAPTLFRFNVSGKAPCDFDNFEVSNGSTIQLFK